MAEEAKSYSQMRREFYEKFQNKILPLVRCHEHKRLAKLHLAIFSVCLLIIAATIIIVIAQNNGGIFSKSNEGLFKLAFMLYCSAPIVWCFIKKDFENSIKKMIMPTICGCFGNFKWSNAYYEEESKYITSGLIPNFTYKDFDDIFKGSYKDVGIDIVEAEYSRKQGKHTITVFNGVIVVLDMNKNFTGHTVIKQNELIHTSPLADLRFTELEDPEFNKKYDVYTNDEVDARYLITPSFMERLKKMKTAFSANKAECAFYGNYLIIALHTSKDLFSLCSLIKRIDDNRQFFEMYEEIVSIIKLIDHFKLDQKIGL